MEYPLKKRKTLDTGSLIKKMCQLPGIERACVQSVGVQEEGICMDVSLDYRRSTQSKIASLEVERKKARALMEIDRQRMRMF